MAELLQITRGCEYAIKAMVWIAKQPPETIVQADLIAAGAGLPAAFAGNILTRLSKHGLLRAHRGASRGYRLTRQPHELTLLEIIESYDGAFAKPFCFMNRDRACNPDDPCALHATWKEVRESTREVLSHMTLESLARNHQQAPARKKKGKGLGAQRGLNKEDDLRFGGNLRRELMIRF